MQEPDHNENRESDPFTNNGQAVQPIVLKMYRRKVVNPDGTVAMGVTVVDKHSGRQVAGLFGAADMIFAGQRFLQVQVSIFDEEMIESNIALPDSIVR